jgi:2-polyprenyl-6-methoxyphenol hydroxylase-like FAD-dependent oxidoreductase
MVMLPRQGAQLVRLPRRNAPNAGRRRRPGRSGVRMLAIADGARSTTRRSLKPHFGTPSRELFSVDGSPLDERALGIRVVSSKISDEHTAPLTVAQNRFLFNLSACGSGS